MTLRLSEPAGKTAEVTTTRHWTTETSETSSVSLRHQAVWTWVTGKPSLPSSLKFKFLILQRTCVSLGWGREEWAIENLLLTDNFFFLLNHHFESCWAVNLYCILDFWVTSGHFFKLVYSVRQSCIVVVCGYAVYSSCHELFDSCQIFLKWSISSPLCKGTIFLFSQLNIATGLNPWSRKQLSMHLLYSKRNNF